MVSRKFYHMLDNESECQATGDCSTFPGQDWKILLGQLALIGGDDDLN